MHRHQRPSPRDHRQSRRLQHRRLLPRHPQPQRHLHRDRKIQIHRSTRRFRHHRGVHRLPRRLLPHRRPRQQDLHPQGHPRPRGNPHRQKLLGHPLSPSNNDDSIACCWTWYQSTPTCASSSVEPSIRASPANPPVCGSKFSIAPTGLKHGERHERQHCSARHSPGCGTSITRQGLVVHQQPAHPGEPRTIRV